MGEFTIKDSLVSFESPAVMDVTSAKIYFEPVQEGEGDPSPENVRPITGWTEATLYKTGKNLFANQNGARCYVGMKAGVTYAISYNASSYAYFRGYDVNGEYVTGIMWMNVGIVNGRRYGTITPSIDIPYGSIYVGSGVSEAQIEVGFSATDYEPYKGPILPSEYQEVEYLESTEGAYTSVSVGIQSTDIFRAEIKFQYLGESTNNFWLAGDGLSKNSYQFEFGRWGGWYHSSDTAIYTSVSGVFPNEIIEASQERTYSENVTLNFRVCQRAGFTAETSNRRIYYVRLLINSNLISNLIPCYRKSDNEPGMYDTVSGTFFTNQGTGEFTVGANVYYDTIPVSWETEAGTVYGGYVDLANGEVVKEWKFITLNGDENWQFSSSWSNDSVYCVYDNNSYNDALFSDYNGIYTVCDQLISGSRNACYSGALKSLECISFSGISTAPKLTIKLSKIRVSSMDDVKAYLAEHTPTVAYKLATPITYQLTPETIKTLKGTNNFWGNTNADTEITYEVADALKMTQIRKNILMSQPHIESATAANPLTFQTDISANLKDCKIHFEPVQEGEGDPSPENVRAISGWDGVTVYKIGKNLLPDGTDNTFWQKGYINSSGNVVSSNEYLCTINPVKIKAGTYALGATYHQAVKTNYKGVYVYDKNGTKLLFRETTAMSLTFTVTTDAYVKLYMHNALTSELQLELGSEPSAYEPYIGTSITIPFPQTIYGGYVDLVKGEVVETWVGFTFDGVNKKVTHDYMTDNNKYIRAYWVYWSPKGTNVPSKRISVICDKLPVVRNDSTGISSTPCLYAAGNGAVFGGLVLGTKEDYPDLAEGTKADRISAINAWFAENPTTVVYSKSESDTKSVYSLADGLNHITLGQDISPRPNGRSSTGGYANSSVIGSDGCTFVYFELGWTTEEFLQYCADISRQSEFVSDSRVLTNSTTTNAKLGDMVLSTASTTDYDGDALVYLYVSLPSDCTDLASKRAYLAEHPIKITYPKKTPIPYTVDLTDLKPVKGTNNIWSDANSNIEVKFWKH